MLGNRIAIMNAGGLVEIGAGRELFLFPKTEFAARFLGSGHVLPCEIIRQINRGENSSGADYIPAVYMLPDYMPMTYAPIEHTQPEYTHYEVSTQLGTMIVPASAEPSAGIRQGSDRRSIDFSPVDGQVKLFIPHDAISLEESPAPSNRSLPGRKRFSALCQGSFFNGPNLVVKVLLPASEHIAEQFSPEQSSVEIIAGPRTNIPAPGSAVDLGVDQSLLRFVRADSK